jgi:hypothetical protein
MRLVTIFAAASLALAAACGNNASSPHDAGEHDAGMSDAGGADASCFTNPTTNNEIINACTTAQKIYKDSHPPLQLPDGGLPPLP